MNNLDLPGEQNYSLMKVYLLTVSVYGSYTKTCGTGSQYIHFFTANGVLMFHFEEHGREKLVTHQQNLKDLFPDVEIVGL